ncbi:unnamed protein product [Cylindrotheca closterium]|uniref:Transcription factor CBF/NF-Y/archaeal histone domain-containing protein n=1 Tax=Cylindrotheca closterium TaxID=2856 RepID=A0AAD2FW75_9STRA|nr:unnamed protein product [Cylindrotheca closterium]
MTSTPGTKASSAEATKQGPPSAVEFEPPLACVRRILKNSLPGSTNVGKDASAAFARSTGIFIIYLTACANDFARENRRQTITANDVLAAVKELEFDEMSGDLQKFLEKYREAEKSKKVAKAAAKKEAAEDEEAKVSTPASVKSKEAAPDTEMADDADATDEEREDDTTHGDGDDGDNDGDGDGDGDDGEDGDSEVQAMEE